MKKAKRNNWIPFLMVLSQILLTGFVVYWLVGQYKSERVDLQKQVYYEFMEAQNQAMDSTLYGYLHPLIMDSLYPEDSFPIREHIQVSFESLDTVHRSARFTTKGLTGESTFKITTMPNQDLLLKGVKMIIQMSTDSLDYEGIGSHSPFPEVDSALFLSFVSDRLTDSDHPDFEILWYQDSLYNSHLKPQKRIRFQSTLSSPAMVYEVANYEPYLLREIIPQILFALFLLLLTASAFILTYRSLRRQVLLNTLRNEFVSNVSHELKTPVSTVKVALESLMNYDLKKDAAVSDEYLKMASLEMDRLDLLIQKILDQSLLESQKVVVNKQESDLVKLTQDVIRSLMPRVLEMNGSIQLNTEIEDAPVLMDDIYIQGVLMNLLDNGLKYGGNPPILDLNIRMKNGIVTLSVTDNGQGINKEYHKKVFERFFRVPSGNKHNVKGYGLGLSFAFQVMEQHGGAIEVSDSSSGGCVFTITFPG
ncbi:MAG: HAMP domain-containing sensor histidine kinase [Bacteroidota bacterium]|nr:HAMP domain-containing sensor histidine kinase [Bacteroidota bacterium]